MFLSLIGKNLVSIGTLGVGWGLQGHDFTNVIIVEAGFLQFIVNSRESG